jgi:carbamoyl-phosphate synthase large subunit
MPSASLPRSVLVVGSGPIVIGQASEFDYSGTQSLKALRRLGVRSILLNPNPATIMTDPEMADRTYLEPLTLDTLKQVLAKERPQALLATMGGQSALNLGLAAHRQGLLKRHGTRLIGANASAIRRAEDRVAFRRRMLQAGLPLPQGAAADNLPALKAAARKLSFPLLLRASFTLGGLGSSLARDMAGLEDGYRRAVELSGNSLVVAEEFLEGWQEFELEVMRDRKDNCVVVCSLENIDPMGVHTGDSAVVAPIQTLRDQEYQDMRLAAFACIRAVGVETGGANVQFARNPKTGKLLLIEINPRVSRSSALASKATGVPIASVATELALGRTLDEIPNGITAKTTAAFEPALDYVVVKLPQFQFSKFPSADPWLNTSMKSVGEAMAIGRSFPEALQKAVRSLEDGQEGLDLSSLRSLAPAALVRRLSRANPERLFAVKEALDRGWDEAKAARLSGIHPWFIRQIGSISRCGRGLRRGLDSRKLREAKALGFSDAHIARLAGGSRSSVARRRETLGIDPLFGEVDTCAGEFEASTPYYYSSYSDGGRGAPRPRGGRSRRKRYLILGAGPNRIGEGIEFDYSCVHAAQAIREAGAEAVILNSNPETVSTDFDVSDRLYFDPVNIEETENVLRRERPDGVILQFGGQTPLNLAQTLARGGWPILGTSADAVARSEDRVAFAKALEHLNIPYPPFRVVRARNGILRAALRLGFPVLVRPSFALGGERIRLFRNPRSLAACLERDGLGWEGPFIIDRFLNPASEIDVDAVSDGRDIALCGILDHVEPAGVHSGDSSMLHPARGVSADLRRRVELYVRRLAAAFMIKGLFNLQIAVFREEPYVIELNPRASRTIPFLSKATGVPWAKVATRVLLGKRLRRALSEHSPRIADGFCYAKASVFSFHRFPGLAPALGLEMRSTGESMGIARTSTEALAKAMLSVAPRAGKVRFENVHSLQELDKNLSRPPTQP